MSQEHDLDDIAEQQLAEQTALSQIPSIPDQALPTRQYLEKAVIDQLQDALKALARERPKNPIEFFSYYLLTQHCNKKKELQEQ
ncbi:unnamed protein product [Paramecium pentaurelia]|uniref:Uncharacterized protein n=1 Tax=Paramecium pentaurelia TaxID=43138 RepID=A0A8S1THC7_9CILI|nr:unnamed protein product [Paramecium pentaurelia]